MLFSDNEYFSFGETRNHLYSFVFIQSRKSISSLKSRQILLERQVTWLRNY